MNDFEYWFESQDLDCSKEEARYIWNEVLDQVVSKRKELSYKFSFSGETRYPSTHKVIEELKR